MHRISHAQWNKSQRPFVFPVSTRYWGFSWCIVAMTYRICVAKRSRHCMRETCLASHPCGRGAGMGPATCVPCAATPLSRKRRSWSSSSPPQAPRTPCATYICISHVSRHLSSRRNLPRERRGRRHRVLTRVECRARDHDIVDGHTGDRCTTRIQVVRYGCQLTRLNRFARGLTDYQRNRAAEWFKWFSPVRNRCGCRIVAPHADLRPRCSALW